MYELILKILRGKTTPEEEKKVKRWLDETEDNHLIYSEISKAYYRLSASRKWSEIDLDKAKFRMAGKLGGRLVLRKWTFWLTGAAALVLLTLGGLWWLNREYAGEITLLAQDRPVVMKAGEKKAVLTLADGRKVELNAKNVIVDLGGVKAEDDSVAGLVYRQLSDSVTVVTEYNTLTVPRAGEYMLTLSDGTRVWLNSETKLRYPVAFAKDSRTVYIEGEAYFDVVKDPQRPFIVCTAATQTVVHGTAFNVMAYRDEEETEITLVRGSVTVKAGEQSCRIIPGHQVQVDNASGQIQERQVNTAYYASWKEGVFDFEGMTLRELAVKLGRWYDVDFFFVNPSAEEKRFTGAIKRNNSLQFMLDFIRKTSGVNFSVKGKTVTVYNQ